MEIKAISKLEPVHLAQAINDENHTVEVLAVISTDRNPKIWEEKSNRQ